MKKYYEVIPASSKYQGLTALTYSSEAQFLAGDVVVVPLRNKNYLGMVLGQTNKFNSSKTKDIVAKNGQLPPQIKQLIVWLSSYYPAALGPTLQLFLPQFLTEKPPDDLTAKSEEVVSTDLSPLTKEQGLVLKEITKLKSGGIILHGETGSGKTRIYLELAKKCLKNNRSAVILTPEIALTPQLIDTFRAEFPNKVIFTHSTLKPTERRLAWYRAQNSKQPLVVIGPRSALFLPVKNIGLIVMDEAHEPAYKNETAPRYQTSRVVGALAKIHGALAVYGSATPLVQDFYLAGAKGLPILKMKGQASTKFISSRNIKLIDLLDKTNFKRHPVIAEPLLNAIETALQNGEQSLIFLNRRGSARLILCNNCGWRAICPKCSLPLVYHSDNHRLNCHNCGFRQNALTSCPTCGGQDLIFKGIGTKSLEAKLGQLFPKARIKRFDADNLKKDSFSVNYGSVISGEVDILVGTQILAKGLDLPRLSVVGVILADTALSFPDYTADERTYSMLYQVAGRVGRGHLHGNVFIQTYDIKNPVLEAVKERDWEGFYTEQLKQRQQFGYPPFNFLLKLTIEKSSSASAMAASQELVDRLSQTANIKIWGPAPSFKEKLGNKYKWQLVVRSKNRKILVDIIKSLPSAWRYDLDPSDLL